MDPENREYVSPVECVSAGGLEVPSNLILSGKKVLELRDTNDLDGDTLFSTRVSRYSNDELAMDSLRIPRSQQKRTDRSLMDSHHGWIWLTHDI